jgi:hypothetical protein
MTKAKTAKNYAGSNIPLDERPWSCLITAHQEARLDRLPWHEREHFLKLLEDARPLVQMRAKRSSFLNMKYLIATMKAGGDPGAPKPKHAVARDAPVARAAPAARDAGRSLASRRSVAAQARELGPAFRRREAGGRETRDTRGHYRSHAGAVRSRPDPGAAHRQWKSPVGCRSGPDLSR